MFRLIEIRNYPRKTKRKLKNVFQKRQQARQFCRNHRWEYEELIILHPDGTQEPFNWNFK